MNKQIEVTKILQSRLPEVDFDTIPFGKTFSDHMFVADYYNGSWKDFRIVPFGRFDIHPACLGLHYGQSIFEGMKASKSKEGKPFLFRPEMHATRLNRSARRMCMPEFPEDMFVDAIHALVDIDQGWIPEKEGSALYIRPFMFANGEFIGVKPSDQYKFIIFTGPVGPYYPKPVRLKVEEKFVRAIPGGVGEAKTAGNYAASLLPARNAVEAGYDQVVWMDGYEFKYVQEVGTMNLFFVIDDTVYTPSLNGAILAGITRDCFLQILKSKGIPAVEKDISIDEIVAAHEKGTLQEIFGAGTAAVVAHVSDITYREKTMVLPPLSERKIGQMLKNEINGLRSGEIIDTHNWIVPVNADISAEANGIHS